MKPTVPLAIVTTAQAPYIRRSPVLRYVKTTMPERLNWFTIMPLPTCRAEDAEVAVPGLDHEQQ
jgi:hypothetical protein